jgi:hypothetical protein
LTALRRKEHRMPIEIHAHEVDHRSGESATHPAEPRYGTLAALLVVVGIEPTPPRALPAHRIAAQPGASNCGI